MSLSFVTTSGPTVKANRRSVAPASAQKATEDYPDEVVEAILAIDRAGRAHDNLSAEEAIALLQSWM